jgi:hypothetical protein
LTGSALLVIARQPRIEGFLEQAQLLEVRRSFLDPVRSVVTMKDCFGVMSSWSVGEAEKDDQAAV